MPYISATELIMYAPCFLRLPISSTTPVLPICHPERGRAKRCPPESKDLRLTRRFELFASHGIHQMGQPVMHHLALRLHPISLRYGTFSGRISEITLSAPNESKASPMHARAASVA